MKKKTLKRTNLIIRISFVLIFIFLLVSVINLQVRMKDLRDKREEKIEKVNKISDRIDELEIRISAPMDDDYIERVARERLGFRNPNEIIFYNDIAD